MTATPAHGVQRQSRRVMNLAHLLRSAARRHGAEIGFVHGEATWTWGDIEAQATSLAAGLAAGGVAKGGRVLVQSRNRLEMFVSMFACFRLGAVWVPTLDAAVPLLRWDTRMGVTTMTWVPALGKFLVCVGTPSVSPSMVGPFDTYILEGDTLTGPFSLVAYMPQFGVSVGCARARACVRARGEGARPARRALAI